MGVTGMAPRAEPADDGLPHVDYGPQLNLVFWLLCALSGIFLGLRVYCKVYRGRKMWWDDYVLIASWVAFLISAATTSRCVTLGYGLNAYDMPKGTNMSYIAVYAGFFSVLSAAWSKTSFGLTMLRICTGWVKWFIWFIIITVNAILGVAMLLMWVKCQPFNKIWEPEVDGTCIDGKIIVYFYQWSAGWSGSADIILALLPWTILFNMRPALNVRERLGVAVAMSMGIVAGAASFVKMVMLPKLTGDPAETVAVTIWGGTEGTLTIIAASIPVLRALVSDVKKSLSASKQFNTLDEHHLNTTSLETLNRTRRDKEGDKEADKDGMNIYVSKDVYIHGAYSA